MNPTNIVIRFEQVDEQTEGPVKRVVGFVRAKNMLQLFDAADLEHFPLDVNQNSYRGFPRTRKSDSDASDGNGGGGRWRRDTRTICGSGW
jgi:hypothetical protein